MRASWLVLLLLVPTAVAFHFESLPILAHGDGAGWHAFKVYSDGGTAFVDLVARGGSAGAQAAMILFDEVDRPWGVFRASATSPPLAEIRTQSSAVGENVVVVGPSDGAAGGTARIGVIFNDPDLREPAPVGFIVLAWGEGDWDVTVRGAAGVEILGTTAGNGTYFLEARDFEGVLAADAGAAFVTARANALSFASLDVERTFYGVFWPTGRAPTEFASVQTPQWGRPCPCWVDDLDDGAGTYTFSLVGADGGPFSDVGVFGADAALPG